MAAKKKTKGEKPSEKHYSDYPIKTLFQISILAGAITFVLSYVSNPDSLLDSVFRAFLVFSIVAILGGLIIITVVSILSKLREQQAEELKKRIELEQKEFFENQMHLQEEMEKIRSEGDTEDSRKSS